MTTLTRNSINSTSTFDINKALKSVATYAWISAGVFFVGYVYFVGAITFSVIKERGLQQETKALISSMGQQELAYLSSQKSLTEEYALQQGFIKPVTITFAPQQKAFAWNVGR